MAINLITEILVIPLFDLKPSEILYFDYYSFYVMIHRCCYSNFESIYSINSLDPLKMRTPCNGDFFTPDSINRGGQTDARW